MGFLTSDGRFRVIVAVAACAAGTLLVTPRAVAQTDQEDQPEQEALPGAEDEPQLPRPASETRSVRPVRRGGVKGVRPGLTEGVDWLGRSATEDERPRRILVEGTFLSGRDGTLVRGPAGRLIFVPGHENRAPGEGPMLVLPCATLERLERAMELDPTLERVAFTGQVTVYDRRNYLLPTQYARLGEVGSAPESADDAANESAGDGDAGASDQPAPALQDDPEVRELIEALEARPRGVVGQEGASERNELDSTGVSRAVAEGAAMVRRRGRLVRDGAGGWTLRFDNGPSTGPGDEPLGVLPCMLLMEMERRAERGGDDLDMLVSGRIYSYEGQGYVLPTMMQLVPRGGINPLQ
ncbi:MAG: hypothetical protein R3B57_04190 [Phycisphaerales bacterium]